VWALSSVGRASALQAEGHKFESCSAHHTFPALVGLALPLYLLAPNPHLPPYLHPPPALAPNPKLHLAPKLCKLNSGNARLEKEQVLVQVHDEEQEEDKEKDEEEEFFLGAVLSERSSAPTE